jgi:hypothetical protein
MLYSTATMDVLYAPYDRPPSVDEESHCHDHPHQATWAPLPPPVLIQVEHEIREALGRSGGVEGLHEVRSPVDVVEGYPVYSIVKVLFQLKSLSCDLICEGNIFKNLLVSAVNISSCNLILRIAIGLALSVEEATPVFQPDAVLCMFFALGDEWLLHCKQLYYALAAACPHLLWRGGAHWRK